MNQHVDFVEVLQKEVIYDEISYVNLKTLNANLNKNDSLSYYMLTLEA